MTIESEITRSQHVFTTVVWPRFTDCFKESELLSVESIVDSQLTQWLDRTAGIDNWMLTGDLLTGIASRIQYGPNAYLTFTLRKAKINGATTEYSKRSRAIADEALYPKWTIQAYVENDKLLAAAAVKTRHLVERCDMHQNQVKTNWSDGTQFFWIRWDQCDQDQIHIVDEQQGQNALEID
jgi:hypothetical protein